MILKSLIINNLYSFGEGVIVSFDQGRTLICGKNNDEPGMDSNGSGKSSIPNVVFFVITGEIFQKENTDEIIRNGCSTGSGELTLLDEGLELKIFRSRGKKKQLKLTVNGTDRTCTTDTKTQEELFKLLNVSPLLKTTEFVSDYLNTNYFSTSTVKSFVSKETTSKERFALIERYIGAKKYSWASKYAKDKKKELLDSIATDLDNIAQKEAIINGINSKVIDTTIHTYETDISEKNNNIIVLEQMLIDNKDLQQNIENIASLKNQIELVKGSTDNQLNSLDSQLELNTKTIINNKEQIKKAEKLNEEILLEQQSIQVAISRQKEITEGIDNYNKVIASKNKDKGIKLASITSLNNQITKHLSCPKCTASLMIKETKVGTKSETKLEIIDLDYLKKTIKDLQTENVILDETITAAQRNIASLIKESQEITDKLQRYNLKVNTYQNISVQKLLLETQQLEINNTDITNRYNALIENASAKVSELKKELEILEEKNKEFVKTAEISVVKQNIETLKKEISSLQIEIGKLEKTKSDIVKVTSEVETLTKKVNNIKQEAETYGFWEIGFNEIKMQLIDEFLPSFEDRVNHYLERLKVDMRVSFDTQKDKSVISKKDIAEGRDKKEEFNIQVYSGDNVYPFGMLSQGERGRISSCVGMALRELTKEKGSNILDFFFMDEIADALDETGLRELIMLLDEVHGQKIVISHNDIFKDYFDNKILVEKTNKISCVVHN